MDRWCTRRGVILVVMVRLTLHERSSILATSRFHIVYSWIDFSTTINLRSYHFLSDFDVSYIGLSQADDGRDHA
jgi:hypothetical protein